MRKPKQPTPEEIAQYTHDLAEARAALEGRTYPELDVRAEKTAYFLISNQGFRVQFQGSRRLATYFSAVAPTVLCHLLRWAGAPTPCVELRAVSIPADAPKLRWALRARTDGKYLLWLRDAGEVIRFALRRDSEELRGAAWPPPVTPGKLPRPSTSTSTRRDRARTADWRSRECAISATA